MNKEQFEKYNSIPREKFAFTTTSGSMHDQKLETKPVGYMRDAFRRFCKNKGSVVAAVIILMLFLFAIFAPIFSQYTVSYRDGRYTKSRPKSHLAVALGLDFWDGCESKDLTQTMFEAYYGINKETGHEAVKNGEYENYKSTTVSDDGAERITQKYKLRLDSIYSVGVIYKSLTVEEYTDIQEYQDRTGTRILYPVVSKKERLTSKLDSISLGSSAQFQNDDGYFWFKIDPASLVKVGTAFQPVALKDENGNFINNYRKYSGLDKEGNPWDGYFSTVLMDDEVEAGERLYDYGIKDQTGYEVRIDYYEYYKYLHVQAGDGIKEPWFLFGTNAAGQDILTCLASGARFSFLMAIAVSLVNMFVGAIYGAIEGYYGGTADIIMERISDILGGIPMMIVLVLVRLHLREAGVSATVLPVASVFLAFFATGWMGMAGTVRMQFYRFKNQEYVLAARTLGARDWKIMWKHIFPNSLGTIVTSCVLVIPSFIFSESSLSYLGIIDLSTSNITSVGSMLANSQAHMTSAPHIMFFPALFICLLMLSFNLFGNGLRDAFNPSLRGSEG